MLQRDFIINEISKLVNFIAATILNKQEEVFEINGEKRDLGAEAYFSMRLIKLADSGEINKGENLLFEELQKEASLDKLLAGVEFYKHIDKLSDETLKNMNFSKEEIKEGLLELKKIAEKV